MPTIALLTDFGLADWYVGTMKGVILTIAPNAAIVDLTHGIPPGDVRAAAVSLLSSYHHFPAGTIFCAVVDPGVGSGRAPLAVRTGRHLFVGPDNGLFSFVLASEPAAEIRAITDQELMLDGISNVFHGRDVFAPAAAHLATGVAFESVGKKQRSCVTLPWDKPKVTSERIGGTVIYIDRFGNAMTNIPVETIAASSRRFRNAYLAKDPTVAIGLHEFYQEVPIHTPLCLIGSSGFLEISVNGGSAAEFLRIIVGDKVELRV